MISRRKVLQGLSAFGVGSVALSGYALGVEPMSVGVTRYRVSPANWPKDMKLRIVAIADVHACEPWMSPDRVRRVEMSRRSNLDMGSP